MVKEGRGGEVREGEGRGGAGRKKGKKKVHGLSNLSAHPWINSK